MQLYDFDVDSIDFAKFVQKRTEFIRAIRKFFDNLKYKELIIPLLSDGVTIEPYMHPFITLRSYPNSNKTDMLYLPYYPEPFMKKYLAYDFSNIYTISYSFRNKEENNATHNPEFMMLEWYQVNSNYLDVVDTFKNLLTYLAKIYHKNYDVIDRPWALMSINEAFKQFANIDLKENKNTANFAKTLKLKGYKTQSKNWDELFFLILLTEIEPNLPKDRVVVLYDFPSSISSLCKVKDDDPFFAERFEVFINGIELANGNTEPTDYKQISERLKAEASKRKGLVRVDSDYVKSLKTIGDKQYAGIGVGIYRLMKFYGTIN